jgi:hypothetical protein
MYFPPIFSSYQRDYSFKGWVIFILAFLGQLYAGYDNVGRSIPKAENDHPENTTESPLDMVIYSREISLISELQGCSEGEDIHDLGIPFRDGQGKKYYIDHLNTQHKQEFPPIVKFCGRNRRSDSSSL